MYTSPKTMKYNKEFEFHNSQIQDKIELLKLFRKVYRGLYGYDKSFRFDLEHEIWDHTKLLLNNDIVWC